MALFGRFLGGEGKATARGLALLEAGRFSEAADQLRVVALGSAGVPDDSLASYHFRQALLGEGRRLLRSGEAARAVSWLAEAATLWPRYADLQFLHGAALALAGSTEADEALAAARRALRLNPDYIEARLLEAEVLRRLERPREAAASLTALLESGRRVDHWLVPELGRGAPYAAESVPADLAARLQKVVGGSSPKEEVSAAVALCRAGHWQEGLARFEDLVGRYPRYPDYRTRQAAALYQLGRCDEALAAVDAALALNDDYRLAQDLRGLVLADLLRLREALDHFRAVDAARAAAAGGEAGQVPPNEQLFGAYVRAAVALVCGDPQAALAHLPAGSELGREFARADLLRAAAEDLKGQPAACTRRLARLAEQWPSEALFHHLVISRLLVAGQAREAQQLLGRWPGSGAADARPLYLENLLRLEQGRELVAPQGTAPDEVASVAAAAAVAAVVADRATALADPAALPGEPRVGPEAWALLRARDALRRGDAPAAWAACAGLSAAGHGTEPLVALQTAIALQLTDATAAGWEPPAVSPLAGLPVTVAWLHAQGRGRQAEDLVLRHGRLHPELAVGWWLSVRFWLAPARAWLA